MLHIPCVAETAHKALQQKKNALTQQKYKIPCCAEIKFYKVHNKLQKCG
jgi:hypothetical protein